MLNQNGSKGATRLADTEAVKLGSIVLLPATKGKFREIPSIGDGNCSLNAFALGGLINLILQKHQFIFTGDYEKQFIKAIIDTLPVLEDRLVLYKQKETKFVSGNSYTDLVDPLDNFIKFIEQNKQTLTFNQLEEYIRSIRSNGRNREQVAAIQIGLAPGLRALGCDLYYGFLKQRDPRSKEKVEFDSEAEVDVADLRQDGVYAGQDLLGYLATHVFQLNLHIFQENIIKDGASKIRRNELSTIHKPNEIQDAPVVNMLNIGNGHWNCLISADQEGGLLSCLPEAASNVNSAANSRDSFFGGTVARHSRIVEGKWTTEREEDLKKNSKKDLIKKANDILINAMKNRSIADENGNMIKEQFIVLFDSLENAIHNSSSLNDLLPKCKEFLREKKLSSVDTMIIDNLEKFIDSEAEENQGFSRLLAPRY